MVIVAATGLLATACTSDDEPVPAPSPSPSGGEPVAGGSAVFGVLGAPPTLDPYSGRATDLTYAVVRPLYRSLARFTPSGIVTLDLAESIEPTAGGARVELRAAEWSDGTAVTSRDVVASARRARPPSGFAGLEAKAGGPQTVVLRGDEFDWEERLARLTFVLPEGRAGEKFSGPYRLRRFTSGLEVVYGANPSWQGPGPFLDKVRVQFVVGLGIILELMRDDRMDAALLPATINLDDRLDEMGLQHDEELGWERIYLDFSDSNLSSGERSWFLNGIDPARIETGLVRDDGRLSRTLVPGPGTERVAPGPFRRLPPESRPAGPVLLSSPAGDELLVLAQRMMQRQLAPQGVEIELAGAEPGAFYYRGAGYPGGINLIRAAGAPGLEDPGPRARRTARAWPLFHVETVIAFRETVAGIEVNPTIEGPLSNVHEWWLPRR